MKKSHQDLSDHEVDSSVLTALFPQLAPLKRLINSTGRPTRANAFWRMLQQMFVIALAVGAFGLMSIFLVNYSHYFPGDGEDNLLTGLASTFIGLPLMIVILFSSNNVFDLFYLLVTGVRFDVGGKGLQPVKVIMLVLGFVASFAFAGFFYYHILTLQNKSRDMRQLAKEQAEYFAYLDKGRAAWNEYITSTSYHRVDFSHTDLSKRRFEGFFLYKVKFDKCNLTDTVFENCNLSYADFNDAICHRTSFKDSYLKSAEFNNADMTDVDLTGVFATEEVFNKAKIAPEKLVKLQNPKKSTWHDVSYYDYRTVEWLKERKYYVERKPKGLKF